VAVMSLRDVAEGPSKGKGGFKKTRVAARARGRDKARNPSIWTQRGRA